MRAHTRDMLTLPSLTPLIRTAGVFQSNLLQSHGERNSTWVAISFWKELDIQGIYHFLATTESGPCIPFRTAVKHPCRGLLGLGKGGHTALGRISSAGFSLQLWGGACNLDWMMEQLGPQPRGQDARAVVLAPLTRSLHLTLMLAA